MQLRVVSVRARHRLAHDDFGHGGPVNGGEAHATDGGDRPGVVAPRVADIHAGDLRTVVVVGHSWLVGVANRPTHPLHSGRGSGRALWVRLAALDARLAGLAFLDLTRCHTAERVGLASGASSRT
jgi:hypothetical protein